MKEVGLGIFGVLGLLLTKTTMAHEDDDGSGVKPYTRKLKTPSTQGISPQGLRT